MVLYLSLEWRSLANLKASCIGRRGYSLKPGLAVCVSRMLTATIAWPVAWVVQVGVILSTLGAALQSLTGAPRLLAAIANDDVLPVLKYFKSPDDEEPHLATLFTMLICASCVILGNLDLITPVITMFFLLCYGGVNLSCLLLDLLDAPSWRPRFKFHHWSFSLLGALLCISEFSGPKWYELSIYAHFNIIRSLGIRKFQL